MMILKSDIKNLSVQRLFVFGSSLYTEGKDIDLLVISHDFNGMSQMARVLRLKRNFAVNKIDPQCYTVEEFNRLFAESVFFEHIFEEAIEIYD
jgi:hypothetical protein